MWWGATLQSSSRETNHSRCSMFGGLWGPSKAPPTAKELVKEQKKAVRKSQREIDREMRNLEKGEKKLLGDIKKAAQKGDNGTKRPSCLHATSQLSPLSVLCAVCIQSLAL